MPEKLSFALDREYRLKNDGSDITFNVIFGDVGQSPDTTVKLNTKVLLEKFKESVNEFIVGNDTELDGKVLRVTGSILDTSKKSNKISLTIRVTGGVRKLDKDFTVTVEDEGELVIFSLVVRFFI